MIFAESDTNTVRAPVAMLLVLFFLFTPAVAEMTAEQEWGKQIYFKGTSPTGGEITAIVGAEGVSLPASAVPCASCHGSDGLGRPEGGVIPPDIRWSELTKGYGHVHENGRKHPPFDHSSLARLIRTGVDPADNRLDKSMPLYQMSVKDMRSLVAYMRFLEKDFDPGLNEERILVGTLLPLVGPQGQLGQAMAQAMHAHFTEVNERGGIFGRKLELLAVPYGTSVETTLDNLQQAFDAEGVFAMVGAYTVGLDEPILELLRQQQMPMVGPFTLNPGDAFDNADVFYIYPGFTDQAHALVAKAVAKMKGGKGKLVIIGPQDDNVGRLIDAIKDKLVDNKATTVETLRFERGELDAPMLAQNVQKLDGDAVVFLGIQAELEALLDGLDAIKHYPGIFSLSSFIPRPMRELPEAFSQRIYLSYPTLTSDVSSEGRAEYQQLAKKHALPPGHLQGQVAALAAAKLLEEGLRGAGRVLSRERLVAAIEALYRFDTGLTPPLTYGPNRRIGAKGAHVMSVNTQQKASEPSGAWQEVD